MITITTVSYIHEADLIRMKLEGEGINVFIADQMTASISPLHSGAIGGIRIQIDEKDLEAAREVLSDNFPLADKGMFQCPSCSSDSVEYESVSQRSAYLSLLLFNIPFTWSKRKCTCNDCGHKWKNKKTNKRMEIYVENASASHS